MLFYERHDAAPGEAGAAALPPLFIDLPDVAAVGSPQVLAAAAASAGSSPALALSPVDAAAVGPSPAPSPALPPALLNYFWPGSGLTYSDPDFARRMSGRDGARLGTTVARIPYSNDPLRAEDLRSLSHGKYVTGGVLAFLAGAFQAENVELCAANPPAAFSVEHPALGPHGPTRLARVLFLSSTYPLPRAGAGGRPWLTFHFVDLALLDVVCKLQHIHGDHYASFKLDLWGRALHVYDSIKLTQGGYARIETAAIANDMLYWAATLGKLLGIPHFHDAGSWPVHWYDGVGSAGMPRQGHPMLGRSAGWNPGCDCALFAGSAAKCAAVGAIFAFIQAHMPDLRKQAAFMIDHWWQSKGKVTR